MKTVVEWSKAFNLLWDNIASGKAPGLEEYEKSIFLTQAQNALLKDYFSSNSNAWKEGFDGSERRQADFLSLLVSAEASPVTSLDETENFRKANTKFFQYPLDAVFVVNEDVYITRSNTTEQYTVVPISANEYARLMSAPYKFPPRGTLWRLISHTGTDGELSYRTIELIGKFKQGDTIEYRLRYIRRPKPIILEDLLGGLSIDGQTSAMTCELPEHLHDEILQRAVQIAKIAWIDGKSDAQQNRQ